ncbi:MAG: hypothetical protein K1X78_08070 [Verrucomicrobiaceae bacterium]|nr:hypothetical protein [Verrucomicrobiaceae bacterium]
MKSIRTFLAIAIASAAVTSFAITPEQEKAFVENYKKAFEAKDEKALAAFLYTKGAEVGTIGFFSMMQLADAGKPVTSIELVTPTKEEAARYNKAMPMPDGGMCKMPVKPVRKLVIVIEEKSGDSTSKSTHSNPVAEVDGKLVIPVPVPAK